MQSLAVQSYHTQPTEQCGSYMDPTTNLTFRQQNAKIAKLHRGITACIGTTAASTLSFGASQCIAELSSPKAQIACGGIAMFSLVFGLVLSRFALTELKNTQVDLEKQHAAFDDRENALADWKTELAIQYAELDEKEEALQELEKIQKKTFEIQLNTLETAKAALIEQRRKKNEAWQARPQQGAKENTLIEPGPLQGRANRTSGISYSCTSQIKNFTYLSNPQERPIPPSSTFPTHV